MSDRARFPGVVAISRELLDAAGLHAGDGADVEIESLNLQHGGKTSVVGRRRRGLYGLPEERERLLQAFTARRGVRKGRRRVVDVVRRDQLVHGVQVARADLLVEAKDDRLVLLR